MTTPRAQLLPLPDGNCILIFDNMPKLTRRQLKNWRHSARDRLISTSCVVAVMHFRHRVDIPPVDTSPSEAT